MSKLKFISRKRLLQQLDLYSPFIRIEPYKSSYRLFVSIDYLRALTRGYPNLMKYCLLTSDLYHEIFTNYPELFI